MRLLSCCRRALRIIALVSAANCSHEPPKPPPPHLLGQWRSARGAITLDFQQGGILAITVDNPSVTYSFAAEWQAVDSAHIRIIPPPGLPGDVLPSGPTLVTVSVTGRELILTAKGGDPVHYQRVL
jgi:hypothetical protein